MTNKFIKRVAQAIKEEIVDEWTSGEITSLSTGVLSVTAFLIWMIYSTVIYIKKEEDWNFRGLVGHLFGLVVEYVTRIRPQNNHLNQERLDRVAQDNATNEARVRHTEV